MGSLRATCAGLRCGQILPPGWPASMLGFRCTRIMRPSTLGCGGNSMPSSGRAPSRRASSVPIEQRSTWSLAWKITSCRPSRRLWCRGLSSIITVRIPMRRLALSWSRPCNPGGDICSQKRITGRLRRRRHPRSRGRSSGRPCLRERWGSRRRQAQRDWHGRRAWQCLAGPTSKKISRSPHAHKAATKW